MANIINNLNFGGGSKEPLISEQISIIGNWNANEGNVSNGSYSIPSGRKCVGIYSIDNTSTCYLKTITWTETQISMTSILSATGNANVSLKYLYFEE